jgi:hypothetical protein
MFLGVVSRLSSGGVKIFTALASFTTAIILSFTVSRILSLVQTARASEVSNDRLCLAMESGKSVGWDWDVKSGRESSSALPQMRRADEGHRTAYR